MSKIKKKILTDIKVELSEEFDRNFERKAFFTKKWKDRKRDGKGSLMVQTGKLRRSIRARVGEDSVTWTSSEPYAAIHNEGGTITVTKKMKRYFWAKYYETAGKIRYKKSGGISKSSMRLSGEAEMCHSMALMKVGDKITIPKRQFIGDSPEVQRILKKIIHECAKEIPAMLKQRLNKK